MLARRGRLPTFYIRVAKLLQPCQGYDLGKPIEVIAEKIYGKDTFHNRAKARQLIGAARKALGVDIFSVKPVGMSERRYCHLTTVVEYTKAIDDFEKQVDGLQGTEDKLKRERETVEAKRKLKEQRMKRAKRSRT